MGGWFHERGVLWPGQAMSLKVEKVIDHHRSLFQDVLVFESTHHGNVLVLDGVIQVTERDEFAYQEMITHIPMFAHPDPKRVLCIGGGDGGVLREIARHPGVEEIVICEIDKDVIEVSKKYFPSLAIGFDDPRVTVHIKDGAKFMEENQDSFDVIITDSSDPVGPASVLFETPFYKAMYGSLREGGIVCTQGECMWLHLDLIQPLVNAIGSVYSTVEYAYTTIPTYPSGQIGFIVATKGRGSCKAPSRVPTDSVSETLRYYTPELHEAAFVLPAFARRAIFGGKCLNLTQSDFDLGPGWQAPLSSETRYTPPVGLSFAYGGSIHGEEKEMEEDMSLMEKAINDVYLDARSKDGGLSLRNLVKLLQKMDNFDDAAVVQDAVKEIRKANSKLELRNRLEQGVAALVAGKQEFASEIYESVAAEDPDYAEAWNKLGTCRYVSSDHHGAEEAFQKVLALE